MLDDLIQRLKQRDRLALSRLITLVSRGEYLDEIRERLHSAAQEDGRASDPQELASSHFPIVVGFTGSGGVGKSSLIGKLIERISAEGRTSTKRPSVAVLACDPQSPLTGGALLGDRIRMTSEPRDNLFIRSLAVPSGREALANHLELILEVTKAFGFDVILLETVGAGQGDTAIREFADTVVVMVQPEAGDDLQWEKAGVLEVADVVVVHKSDLPQAEHVESELRSSLNLPGQKEVQVLRVSAQTGEGVDELWSCLRSNVSQSQLENAPE